MNPEGEGWWWAVNAEVSPHLCTYMICIETQGVIDARASRPHSPPLSEKHSIGATLRPAAHPSLRPAKQYSVGSALHPAVLLACPTAWQPSPSRIKVKQDTKLNKANAEGDAMRLLPSPSTYLRDYLSTWSLFLLSR